MADKKKTALCISDINKSPPFNRREEQSENKYRDTQTHTDKHTHTQNTHQQWHIEDNNNDIV